MKVCLLNTEIEINGGTERMVAMHANHLKKQGHEVTIACAYYNPTVYPEEYKKHKIIEYAPKTRKIKTMHRTRISLKLLTQQTTFLKEYDTLIANRPFTNILAMNAKKQHHNKTLWYCNHPEKHLYPQYFKTLNNKKRIFQLTLLPGLKKDQESIKTFNKIWTNSHHMWTKFNLIYNHKEHNVLYPAGENKLKKSSQGEHIISISRVEPEKNQKTLLKALKQLDKPPKTIIIGKITNKEYHNELKKYIKKHELPVKFTGRATDKEIQEYYNQSFLNIYTPHDEDFGLVPIESINTHTPSLSHVSNGVSEVIPTRHVYSTINELSQKIQDIKEGRIKKLTTNEKKIPKKIRKEHLNTITNNL